MKTEARVSSASGIVALTILRDGEMLGTIDLDPAIAGALGGQLISAAHAPLPRTFTVEGETGRDGERTAPPTPSRPVVLAKPAPPQPQLEPEVSETVQVEMQSGGVTVPEAYAQIAETTAEDWTITYTATRNAEEAGVAIAEILDTAMNPAEIRPASQGEVDSYLKEDISVLVPRDSTRKIIGVRREWHYQQGSSGTQRAPSGGSGKSVPSTYKETVEALKCHGFSVEQLGKSPHPKVTHPGRPGVSLPFPKTASDHRAHENFVAQARRMFGIDISRAPQD